VLALLLSFTAVLEASATGDDVRAATNIVDFSETDRVEWRIINDGVMGGVSQGQIGRTTEDTGLFRGVLRLENNGGFASVRAELERHDLSAYSGLEVRVRGDGRTYQLRLRTDQRFDGITYRAAFETSDGEWATLRIAFEDFVPSFRGQILRGVPPLDRASIHQLGFMFADKQPGPFALEIDYVRAWSSRGDAP
jgi:monofunctional biosynthetic peptidoglycan transglycosylase